MEKWYEKQFNQDSKLLKCDYKLYYLKFNALEIH